MARPTSAWPKKCTSPFSPTLRVFTLPMSCKSAPQRTSSRGTLCHTTCFVCFQTSLWRHSPSPKPTSACDLGQPDIEQADLEQGVEAHVGLPAGEQAIELVRARTAHARACSTRRRSGCSGPLFRQRSGPPTPHLRPRSARAGQVRTQASAVSRTACSHGFARCSGTSCSPASLAGGATLAGKPRSRQKRFWATFRNREGFDAPARGGCCTLRGHEAPAQRAPNLAFSAVYPAGRAPWRVFVLTVAVDAAHSADPSHVLDLILRAEPGLGRRTPWAAPAKSSPRCWPSPSRSSPSSWSSRRNRYTHRITELFVREPINFW